MAPELSSNWRKLQAKIKAESTNPGVKRKAGDAETEGADIQSRKRRQTTALNRAPGKKSISAGTGVKGTHKPKMGAAQSSKVDATVPGHGVAPSLALWAQDNDISSQDLAEAYGLGIKNNTLVTEEAARPNEGLAPGLDVGKYIAIDCEMVGVGEGGHESALARVSIVDFLGRQVYDSFVRPTARVTNWRTEVSGVSPKNMATARDFDEVQKQVASLLKGRILVGHDVKHDLEVLFLNHPARDLRDTAKFHGFKKYGNGPKPALKTLAHEILGMEIQSGQHSSIVDARVAMLLFRKQKPAFDVDNMNRFQVINKTSKAPSHGKKGKKGKKRKN